MLFRSGPSGTDTRVSRDEVQGPQEGRRSPRRAAKPSAIETPRARNGQASADPDQGCGRRFREERSCRGGNTPGGDKTQGRHEPSTLLHGRRGNGLPRMTKPGRRARSCILEGGSPAMSQRQAGWVGREARPEPWKGNPSEGESQERYRRETKPERFREEKRVKRVRNPEGAA